MSTLASRSSPNPCPAVNAKAPLCGKAGLGRGLGLLWKVTRAKTASIRYFSTFRTYTNRQIQVIIMIQRLVRGFFVRRQMRNIIQSLRNLRTVRQCAQSSEYVEKIKFEEHHFSALRKIQLWSKRRIEATRVLKRFQRAARAMINSCGVFRSLHVNKRDHALLCDLKIALRVTVHKTSTSQLSVLDERMSFKVPCVISNTALSVTPNGLEPH